MSAALSWPSRIGVLSGSSNTSRTRRAVAVSCLSRTMATMRIVSRCRTPATNILDVDTVFLRRLYILVVIEHAGAFGVWGRAEGPVDPDREAPTAAYSTPTG